jgi:hypothetical protein
VFGRKSLRKVFSSGRSLPELSLRMIGFEFAVGKQKNLIEFSSGLIDLGKQTAHDEFAQPAGWVAGDWGFCSLMISWRKLFPYFA